MQRIGLIVLAIAVCSCSATIQSNKAKDFNDKVKKFYAVIRVADNTGNFMIKFSESFREELKLRGVEIQFEAVNPLSLETDEDLMKRVNESNADAVLLLNQTESVTYTNSNAFYFGGQQASGGSFDIKIFVPNSSKPVWRGLLKATSNGFGSISAAGKSSAERIAEKLIQDGVI